MTTPSGQISLSDIQAEFGGSDPIGLNEYYALAGYVPSGQNVPGSGAISFNDLRGKSRVVTITTPADTDLYNVNLRQFLIDSGWDQSSVATYTISSTTRILSNDPAIAALTITGTYPNGLTVINNGKIIGRGGKGGINRGGFNSGGGPGGAGGAAIKVTSTNCVINNANGTIAGGGGGGGAAGSPSPDASYWVESGGGGGGAGYGTGGDSGAYAHGAAGGESTGGAGGVGYASVVGGAGGAWGKNGNTGGRGENAGAGGGLGGRAGPAIDGFENVTITNIGTMIGPYKFNTIGSEPVNFIYRNELESDFNQYFRNTTPISGWVNTGGHVAGVVATSYNNYDYWGPLNPQMKTDFYFPWYLAGANIINNMYLGTNGTLMVGVNPANIDWTQWSNFSATSPAGRKLTFDANYNYTYNSYIGMNSTYGALVIYFPVLSYTTAYKDSSKEIVFFNPLHTNNKMVVSIRNWKDTTATGSAAGAGASIIGDGTDSDSLVFNNYMSNGSNVVLVGDSNGRNWKAYSGWVGRPLVPDPGYGPNTRIP